MYHITLKMLEKKHACEAGLTRFKEAFGESVDVSIKAFRTSKVDWRRLSSIISWTASVFLPVGYIEKIEEGCLSEIEEMKEFLLPDAIYIEPIFDYHKMIAKHFVIQYNSYMDSKKKKR